MWRVASEHKVDKQILTKPHRSPFSSCSFAPRSRSSSKGSINLYYLKRGMRIPKGGNNIPHSTPWMSPAQGYHIKTRIVSPSHPSEPGSVHIIGLLSTDVSYLVLDLPKNCFKMTPCMAWYLITPLPTCCYFSFPSSSFLIVYNCFYLSNRCLNG